MAVGGCLGFGRACRTDFGVGRVGCGIGCGEFWGVVLGFGWDRWGSRVDKEQLGGGTRTAQKLIEGRGNRPRKKYWGKGSTDHAKSSRGEGVTDRAKSIGGREARATQKVVGGRGQRSAQKVLGESSTGPRKK